MKREVDRSIIEQLQQKILQMEGDNRPSGHSISKLSLGDIESAFPNKTFPLGAVHELISTSPETASSTNGFISVVLGKLLQRDNYCLWIGKQRIYPPALKLFGIEPDHVLFIDASRQKDILWAIEEALKCDALTAVVGELHEINFNDSRRLQLAVERSRVTGFIHRHCPKSENAVACVSRWKISPISSALHNDLPGVGFPRWNVELLKVKNGKPQSWQVQWSPKGLEYLHEERITVPYYFEHKTG